MKTLLKNSREGGSQENLQLKSSYKTVAALQNIFDIWLSYMQHYYSKEYHLSKVSKIQSNPFE